MITGEIKNRIDSIWDAFWTGGITNSMDILAQMTGEAMCWTVSKDVFVFIKNLNEGKESAYSKFMAIDILDMNNRDTMGDIYEYVLGKMAASGNNGQFRTPRHIIRMMVELMQPTLKDSICDPAMGSAGFIVESAKYIQDHYK